MFSISRRQLSVIAAALALAACNTSVNEQPPAPELGAGYRTDLTTQQAKRHMAAAANPLAAEAGRTMLRQGGSAIDAAVAMQAVLTLVEPQSSGIGGGCSSGGYCSKSSGNDYHDRCIDKQCNGKDHSRRCRHDRPNG